MLVFVILRLSHNLKCSRQVDSTDSTQLKPVVKKKKAKEASIKPDGPKAANKNNNNDENEELKTEVKRYYNNKGQWAGKFVISKIRNIRKESPSGNKMKVHAAYDYKAVKGWQKGKDRRYFIFEKKDGAWVALKMGGANSGKVKY